MTKFTFTSEFQGFGSPKNTLEFDCDQLEDVLMYFEQFLKGAGFIYDGHLEIVDNSVWSSAYPEDLPQSECSEGCCGGCDITIK